MNSVHEPGSRTMFKNFDSGKYRVKPGKKQAECTECTAQGQAARPAPSQPCPARSARARACRARPARLPSVRLPCAPRPPVRPAMSARLPRAPYCLRAPAACAPQRPPAPSPARPRTPAWALRARLAPARPASYPSQRPAQLPSLAIYLGSSPKFNFSVQNFFIIINFFFHLSPEIGKITKITIINFFFSIFHNTSNKFLKIYFLHFSSKFFFSPYKTLENYFPSFLFPVLYTVPLKIFSKIFPYLIYVLIIKHTTKHITWYTYHSSNIHMFTQ